MRKEIKIWIDEYRYDGFIDVTTIWFLQYFINIRWFNLRFFYKWLEKKLIFLIQTIFWFKKYWCTERNILKKHTNYRSLSNVIFEIRKNSTIYCHYVIRNNTYWAKKERKGKKLIWEPERRSFFTKVMWYVVNKIEK